MANCIIDSGYPIACKDNVGGVKEVYMRTFSASTVYTYSTDGTITGSTSGVTATPFYKFVQRPETAEFNAGEGQHSNENGSTAYQPTLNLVFTKYQASLRNLLYSIAISDVECIILTTNGEYIIMGETSGAYTTASAAPIGKAIGDLHGATISLISKSKTPCRIVSPTYFSSLTII